MNFEHLDFDPLDLPLGLASPPVLPAEDITFRLPSREIFNGPGFFTYLNKAPKTHLWVMSYTATPLCPLELPVHRLITELGDYPAEEHRRLKIHTKLYLQFLGPTIVGAYLGSQNLVKPTGINLMYSVPENRFALLKRYFLHFWNDAI